MKDRIMNDRVTVKSTVTTENFTIKLPCVMEVSDEANFTDSEFKIVESYEQRTQYHWRCDDCGFMYAKPILKSKIVPWDISDFENAWVSGCIFTIGDTPSTTEFKIERFDKDGSRYQLYILDKWVYSTDPFILEKLRTRDGSKLEKELITI